VDVGPVTLGPYPSSTPFEYPLWHPGDSGQHLWIAVALVSARFSLSIGDSPCGFLCGDLWLGDGGVSTMKSVDIASDWLGAPYPPRCAK